MSHLREETVRRGHAAILSNSMKAALILAVASLLCDGLYRLGVGEQNIIVVMVLAVFLIAAITEGYWYGLGATLAGVMLYDYLVTEPRFGFSITLGFPITLSIMLMVTLTTSAITTRIKKQRESAQGKERNAELMYEINRKLLSSGDMETVASIALAYLQRGIRRSAALYLLGSRTGEALGFYFLPVQGDADEAFFTGDIAWAAAKEAAKRTDLSGAGLAAFLKDGISYQPLVAQGKTYGVWGISCRRGPLSAADQAFADSLTVQTAYALRVRVITDQRQAAVVLAETEKNRNRFLRGISHDLRTPLTSIIGSSETFLENGEQLSVDTQRQLVESIRADAQWLVSMVNNILSVTQIQQHAMTVHKREEAAEEIVSEAISLFRKRFPGADITIREAEELLWVPMDALLITQVLNNLLDNTQRHAGSTATKVTVETRVKDGFVEFAVADTGPGISESALPSLFAGQAAQRERTADTTRGLGIGLSICHAIVEAHGGWIRGSNRPEGGAVFTFALPMEREMTDGE